ncbi:MAG: DCC1-like thiol-disulfide oxidoreductase family protein [Gemmatimonadaceae bacterium]
MLATRLADGDAILLYDGVCGLCDRFVQFVLRHDRHRTLKFATLQGSFGDGARASLPGLADVDSLVLVTPSGAYIRSTAALEVMRYLGGVWSLALVSYVVPRPLRDWVYDQVAKRRYRIWGRYDTCQIPDPAVRQRFLD